MLINFQPIVNSRTVRLTWSRVAGTTYYVYRDGVLVNTTTGGEARFAIGSDPVVFEVFDDQADVPTGVHNPKKTIKVGEVAIADRYTLQKKIGMDYVAIDTLGAGTRDRQFTAAGGDYKILAPTDAGESATPVVVVFETLAAPATPDIDTAYDEGTGLVTFTKV